jgi:hypothetical protein
MSRFARREVQPLWMPQVPLSILVQYSASSCFDVECGIVQLWRVICDWVAAQKVLPHSDVSIGAR